MNWFRRTALPKQQNRSEGENQIASRTTRVYYQSSQIREARAQILYLIGCSMQNLLPRDPACGTNAI